MPLTDEEARRYAPAADVLKDRVIVVTGAGGAIGSALARSCAAHGARVVLTGRSVRKLEAVYDSIVAAGHPRPAIAPLDFDKADASHYDAMATAIGAEFGRIDGLAHVAGLLGDRTPVKLYDVPTWLKVMHVNANAAFILTQTLLPLLERSADGSVVFTTSGVSNQGRAYWGAYAASKFAVEGLMQVLADELDTDQRIRVNSINPGKVRSSMRARAYPGEDVTTLAAPETVLAPYLYLLGPDSRDVTGRRLDAQP